jgi:hypothetical protein
MEPKLLVSTNQDTERCLQQKAQLVFSTALDLHLKGHAPVRMLPTTRPWPMRRSSHLR